MFFGQYCILPQVHARMLRLPHNAMKIQHGRSVKDVNWFEIARPSCSENRTQRRLRELVNCKKFANIDAN